MVSLSWKSCERKWGSSQIFTLLLTNKRKPIPTALCRRAAMLKSWTVGDFPGGPAVKTPPSSAGAAGWTPDLGVKIRHASRPRNRNMKQKRYCNKFNKDFKKWCTLKNNLKKSLGIGSIMNLIQESEWYQVLASLHFFFPPLFNMMNSGSHSFGSSSLRERERERTYISLII